MIFNKRSVVIVALIALVAFSPFSAQGGVFHDSLGRAVRVPAAPMRIVSLAPNITEMLYFLGLGHRLAGVSQFSSYPKEAQEKPTIGPYSAVNIERVITLRPDLVIATADGNERGDVALLQEAGIPVYVINPRTVNQVLDTLQRLAEICGMPGRAQRLVNPLRERVARVAQAVEGMPRPLVFLLINVRPFMSVNKNTIHHDLIGLAGGRNMTGNQPLTYPRLNMEAVIDMKPDVIIISSMERGGTYEEARKQWFQWPMLPAVQKRHVYLIDSDLIDRSSPRIVSGLEAMARLIHPEVSWHERP